MSRFLESVADHIRRKGYPIYTISQIDKNGKSESIVLSVANPCQNSYSVAKMFVVTAIGLLYDKDLLSVDEKVIDILKNELTEATLEAIDSRWNKVSVHTALIHALALPQSFLDIDCQDPNEFGTDYLSYMLTYPLTGEHGVKHTYTDGAYYLLSRIAEKRAGKRLDVFLWDELFSKLGYKEVAWSCCPMGHSMGATGLYIRTDDMAKLGRIYLNDGLFGDTRILSSDWIQRVFKEGYELHPICDGVYGKGGMRGQMLAIIPEQKRVIAWHGCGRVDGYELLSFINEIGRS